MARVREHAPLAAVILAGGAGRRMGGVDKGLQFVDGRMLVVQVLDRLRAQLDDIVISANRNIDAYAALGVPVVVDVAPGFRGPLAGLASAMQAVRQPWLLSVPVDVPGLPLDLAVRLLEVVETRAADLAVAHDGTRRQVLCAIQRTRLAPSALAALALGDAAVWAWQDACGAIEVDFSDQAQAFANCNRLEPA